MIIRSHIFLLLAMVAPVSILLAGMDNAQPTIEQKIAAYHLDRKDISIHINKTAHTLSLKIGSVTLRQYKCVFGGNPVDDKKCEGDQCTPEGVFHILSKYPHADWEKFIWIDYSNKESWKKFEANKRSGNVPLTATIGGCIGIHGVPNHRSDIIDQSVNWTLGCISLKDEDVNEIYNYVNAGTEVIITK